MGMVYSEPACQSAYDGDLHRLHHLLRDDPGNLNVQDLDSGDTPLIAACRQGNQRVVQYLLEYGADVTLTNKKQRSCLHYASRRTFSLLDYLMIAILMPILLLGFFILQEKQRKNVALLQTLLSSEVEINAVDYKGNTALHYVCERKSHFLVPLLLERNADATIKNKEGETALDIATRLKFKKIIVMLKKTH
ncbi:ankyrin repeat domain-containing protein 22 isoform X1 [Myripristis murdjan]|uniref:Ankyrin repeat domain 22 n=1 Tax=Myripristis murdjan TaxID=586833 RepID=A0A667YW78_9TELE|nr:ankyrin repeat domain-containing protein 22-like isoform X1 [Myripristis murdjan]